MKKTYVKDLLNLKKVWKKNSLLLERQSPKTYPHLSFSLFFFLEPIVAGMGGLP